MGRPTYCTVELAELIAEQIRRYGFIKPVIILEGVERQHYEWMEKGEANEAVAPYREYAQTIKRAVAEWQVGHLARLQAGQQGWQSSGWSLERSDFATYGNKQQVEHSGSIATTATVNPADLQARRDDVMRQRQSQRH